MGRKSILEYWSFPIFLFLITLFSRLLLRSRYLFGWDSGNFALGVVNYDPILHRPHPPGYPLYIAAGKLANILIGDVNSSLIALSILCSALTVSLIFIAGSRIYDRRVGLVAAVLAFFSPLVWFQGEVALSHIIELPFAILATWLIYEILFNRRYALAAAVIIGIGGGFRQDILLFFGPILFLASFRLPKREMFLSWIFLMLSTAAWLVPLLFTIGDISAYREIIGQHSAGTVQADSFWRNGISGLVENMRGVLFSDLWLMGTAIILQPVFVVQLCLKKKMRRDRKSLFLLALPILPMVFFLATSFSHFGYSLVYAPSLLLLSAFAAVVLLDDVRALSGRHYNSRTVTKTALALLCIAAAGNTMLFLRSWYLPQAVQAEVSHYSHRSIVVTDGEMKTVLDLARQFDPGNTLIVFLGDSDNSIYFRQASYYLYDYRILWLAADTGYSREFFRDTRPSVTQLTGGVSAQYENMLVFSEGTDIEGNALVPVSQKIDTTLVDIPRSGDVHVGPFTFFRAR